MFSLEKQLYAWELQQAYVLKKFILQVLGVVALLLYWQFKLIYIFANVVFERPRLRKQIEPGVYQEVENHHVGPRIQL